MHDFRVAEDLAQRVQIFGAESAQAQPRRLNLRDAHLRLLGRQSFLRRALTRPSIRDQIAREQLDQTFGRADDGRDIQADVERAAKQTLLSDFVPRQPHDQHRPHDRNRLDDSLRKPPPARPQ
jgi:hypothetical protein